MSHEKRSLPVLKIDRAILRLPTAEDIDAIILFYERNAAYLGKYSPSIKEGSLSKGYWLKRIDEAQKDFCEGRACNLFIFSRSENEVLGFINFFNFTRGALQGCTLGYGLAERVQGQGLMTEALQVAIKYVLKELNMHRIEANYHPRNGRSAKMLKKLGFTVEGRASHYLRINNEWQPHIRTSLTNHDWRAE